MMEVAPLPLSLLVLFGTLTNGFPPAFAAFLPARYPFLSFDKLLLGRAIGTWGFHLLAIRRHQKPLHPTSMPVSLPVRGNGSLGTST
jgi:hypothetical protein